MKTTKKPSASLVRALAPQSPWITSIPEYEIVPATAFSVRLRPDQGDGSVHLCTLSDSLYRVVLHGGQIANAFNLTKNQLGALVELAKRSGT